MTGEEQQNAPNHHSLLLPVKVFASSAEEETEDCLFTNIKVGTDLCVRSFLLGGSEVLRGPRGGAAHSFRMLLVTCYCLLAGGVLNLVGTAGGGVSVIFQVLPFPVVFQSLFVISISLGLSAACGFLIVAGKNLVLENVYDCVAVVSVVAAALVLVCAFSSLAYFGMFSLGK